MHRRRFLSAGASIAGLAVAGCTTDAADETSTDDGEAGDGSETTTDATATLEPGTTTDEQTPTESDDSYVVSMEPMGPVEFDGPPERWLALLPSYADMGVALDAGQSLGIQLPYRYASHYYDEVPGVEFDADALTTLNDGGVDKEVFYELDADVHFMEPNQLIHWYDWSADDVAEIEREVGPFFGNFIRRRSDAWHDYPYYSLYGAFEKIARVFRAESRYRAFEALHQGVLASVDDRLPPAEERPAAMLLYPANEKPSAFYPYRLHEGGVGKKQWRDVGLHDAFANSDVGHYAGDTSLQVDFETLLEIDPDALLIRGQTEKTDDEFQRTVVETLRDDPVASKVTAVDEGAIYRGGYLDQGPIIHLFQLERAARAVYPDRFGGEELFDRELLGDVVAGEVTADEVTERV